MQALLAARIDRLPPEDKRLLQTAAVIGTEVPWPLLQAIADTPDEALYRSLAQLQAAEFLYETSLFPERAYTFKHALTHEVAYGSLLQERRRALHARIVEALEALAGDRLDDQVERLAQHALRGEVWDKALAYGRQAGDKAQTRSAYREAVVCYRAGAGGPGASPRQSCRHRAGHRPPARLTHRAQCPGRSPWADARPLAPRRDPRPDAGRSTAARAGLRRHEHQFLGGGRGGPRHRLRPARPGPGRHARACRPPGPGASQPGSGLYDAGDYPRAVESLAGMWRPSRVSCSLNALAHNGIVAATSRAWLSYCHAERGAFTEGLALAEEGLRIAETVHHPFSLIEACRGVGVLYLRQGDVQRAIPVLERAMGLCQDWHIPLFLPMTGRRPGPGVCPGWACRRGSGAGGTRGGASGRQGQTEASGALRSPASARRICWLAAWKRRTNAPRRRSISPASTSNAATRPGPCGSWARARRARRPPEVEPAAGHYRQALALAEELGMRPLQAHCHRGLGTLYATTGQREQARAALSTAIEMYRAMEMTFWLPETEAALAQVEGH